MKPPGRRPRLPMLLSLLLLCSPAAAATQDAEPRGGDPGAKVDADWVLRALARPPPVRTDFVEIRSSPLLKEPLRLSGEYRRPDETTLVRQVRAPYAETTTIATDASGAGQATVARAGRSPRTFSLSRAPELARLQASFGALLSGDGKALREHYDIDTGGTRGRWTMTLVPRQAALKETLSEIRLYGRGVELRCIEMRPAQGEVQRTLLAGAAREAGAVDDAEGIVALCRGGSR